MKWKWISYKSLRRNFRPPLLYGAECWAAKTEQPQTKSVAKTRLTGNEKIEIEPKETR